MELGIEVPVSLSMKLGDPNSLFSRIVSAAENPHLSVPETESGRRSKNIRQLVNSSLVFVSGSSASSSLGTFLLHINHFLKAFILVVAVATALGFAGLAAYRAYSARKNA